MPADAPRAADVLDRRGAERAEPDLLARLFADPATLVLEVCAGRAPVVRDAGAPRLATRPPAPGDADDLAVFLGRDTAGRAHVAVVVPAPPPTATPAAAPAATPTAADAPTGETDPTARPATSRWPATTHGVATTPDATPDATPDDAPDDRPAWLGPRDVGADLGEGDLDRFMTSVALANWHAAHPRCPRCGAPTAAALAGWVRRCAEDGSEHYPRTDPAVIMAVVDADDRLLLARNPAWPAGRRSVLAGFVEPGERLEETVAREVAEEVGVPVRDVRYRGSQPWPFPASLMLGFTARADATDLVLDPAEIAEAEWYSRAELEAAVADGSLGLPGRTSIARRLLEEWFGRPIEPPVEVAFHRPDGPVAS